MKPYICNGSLMDKSLTPLIMINDVVKCVVTEEINGIFEAEIELSSKSQFADMISINTYLAIKCSPNDNFQFFKVYKIEKKLKENTFVYLEHIRYALNYYPCQMLYGENIEALFSRINQYITTLSDIPFRLFTDKTTNKAHQIKSVRSMSELLFGKEESIIDIYGGEWKFNNYDCLLLDERGQNKNVVLQYGYNIENAIQQIEITQGYTHIFPYYEWTLSNGDISTITLSHKSLESRYPMILPRDLVQIDNNYKPGQIMRIYPVNLAQHFALDLTVGYWNGLNIQPLTEIWLETHRSELLGISVSTSVDFAYLHNNPSLMACELGDRVRVRISELGIEQLAKIVKVNYDSVRECYTNMEIGSLKNTISNIIANSNFAISKNNLEIARRTGQILDKGRE